MVLNFIQKFSFYSLILLLTSCKPEQIHEGKVVSKRFEKSRMYTYTTYTKIGKNFRPQFNRRFDDEDYIITIMSLTKGDQAREDLFLDKSSYDKIEIGQIFNDHSKCERDDDGLR